MNSFILWWHKSTVELAAYLLSLKANSFRRTFNLTRTSGLLQLLKAGIYCSCSFRDIESVEHMHFQKPIFIVKFIYSLTTEKVPSYTNKTRLYYLLSDKKSKITSNCTFFTLILKLQKIDRQTDSVFVYCISDQFLLILCIFSYSKDNNKHAI